MAQMAPALTEASASPGSSRKNSVDLFCPSEELKQESSSLGVDLKLLSQNGLVRLLGETNSIADITNTNLPPDKNTPIVLKHNEEPEEKREMPNGRCDDNTEKRWSEMASASDSKEEKRKQQTLDLSRRTCASTTARSSAGTCSTDCEEDRLSQHPVADLESPQVLISKKTARAIQRQTRLENQAKKLGKRLRKLQARQIDVHVHQQLGGFFEQQKEICQSSADLAKKEGLKSAIDVVSENSLSNTDSKTGRNVFPETNNTMSTNLASFTNQVKGTNYITSFGSDGLGNNSGKKNEHSELGNKDIFNISNDQIRMADNVLGRLSSQVEHLENIGDSDATDVSSGEESEGEDAKRYKLRSKRSRTLRKQYCLEEGEVASRWSWLQSQIINVDRRIRRLDELYRGLRASKGPVKLQETKFVVKQPASSVRAKELSKCTPNNSTGLSTVTNAVTSNSVLSKGQADLKLKEVLGDREIHLKNGVRRGLLDEGDVPVKRLCTSLPKTESATNSVCNPAPIDELHNHSARTRGTHPSRKRLLVRLSRFQRHCKPGTVPCTCSTPETPCALCLKTCRTLPVVDVRQPLPEKVSMLDWSFHPTLSFFTDIPLQLHFAALLKKGGFETRTKPSLLRSTVQTLEKKKPPAARKTSRSQLAKGAVASLLSSAKLRNQKYERKRAYSSVPSTPKNRVKSGDSRVCHTDVPRKKRAAAISAAAQLQKRARSLSLPTVVSLSSPPTPTTTSPVPLSHSMPPSNLSSLLRKKRSSNAFDINNIVIPYSMASTTRVEKLQYKEIPTPSWRVFEVESLQESDKKDTEETEDLSEEVVSARHAICEVHERKRFLGLVKKKRKRTQRQSSEMSITDPCSPSASLPDSHSSTPPGTPAMLIPSPTITVTPITLGAPSALSPVERIHRSVSESHLPPRRTSSTDWADKSGEFESWPAVSPFPERTFPLSETEILGLKLPTPLPTPVSSMPASPAASSPGSPMCSPLASPASDQGNDKNEWTVKLVTTDPSSSPTGDTGQPRKGIVLKLAKR